jgi:SAM-dependent methyltransferase
MKVLNIGCGKVRLNSQTKIYDGWKEVRSDYFDNDTIDVVSDILNLNEFDDESFDSVWASHIVEHNYWHDLPKVFGSIMRVLKKDGFAVIRVPDIGSIASLIEDSLLEPIYETELGPVCPIDMLYGFRVELEQYPGMAHKTCFTLKSMQQVLSNLKINAFVSSSNMEVIAILYKDKISNDIMNNKDLII